MCGCVRVCSGERSFPAVSVVIVDFTKRGGGARQLQGVYVLDLNRIASLRYVTLGKKSGTQSRCSRVFKKASAS